MNWNNGWLAALGIEKICPLCGQRFRYCEHCWRGHKYCSPDCSHSGRRKNRRNTEKRYTSTSAGRESRRRRQKNFRSRIILGLKVTDHSPPKKNQSVSCPSKSTIGKSEQCCHCHKPIQIIIGGQFVSSEENNYFSFVRFRSKNGALSFWANGRAKPSRASWNPIAWKLGTSIRAANSDYGRLRYLEWQRQCFSLATPE